MSWASVGADQPATLASVSREQIADVTKPLRLMKPLPTMQALTTSNDCLCHHELQQKNSRTMGDSYRSVLRYRHVCLNRCPDSGLKVQGWRADDGAATPG